MSLYLCVLHTTNQVTTVNSFFQVLAEFLTIFI